MADKSVVIGAMDATSNDAPPEFEVRGFPTIYFKSKAGKVEKYEGGREEANFVEFLESKMDPEKSEL
eukprot:TRINITY_DN5704_c0_g1_i1.p2 TRINITY_DN5704_c0_g1~~TRINITY_DN5704_c0_g1_i1.p2  ORF type:complete len:67 (+),score=18.80 TRINITY_DN5704_c0_g1_i1:268-468(+)